MTKKAPDTSSITNELEGASLFFAKQSPAPQIAKPVEKSLKAIVPKVTSESTQLREEPRTLSSDIPRKKSRGLPTREEIQEFSFHLRDQLKVKVQAEVPHQWQDELEELARKLDVKKLELYRFIIGEFLGKIDRKKDA
jgi:hypothetical protein